MTSNRGHSGGTHPGLWLRVGERTYELTTSEGWALIAALLCALAKEQNHA